VSTLANSGQAPFCQGSYAVSDRMRWVQVMLPLTYDWLLGYGQEAGVQVFSTAEKAAIRRVFLRWILQNMQAYPNPYSYSSHGHCNVAVRTTGDTLLRLAPGADPGSYCKRYAFNNYFVGHMRQIGMLAMAFDAIDDVPDTDPATSSKVLASAPAGELTSYRNDAMNGWLTMVSYMLKNDGVGGQPPEGAEYAPTSGGIPTHLLLALSTANYADADGIASYGNKVDLSTYSFFKDLPRVYLHQMGPYAVQTQRGMVHQPAWFGDGEHIYALDFITVFGPLGVYAYNKSMAGGADAADYAERLNAIRWLQKHIPPGGAGNLTGRASSDEELTGSILYFMLFDPAAPEPTDPRAGYALDYFAPGAGRFGGRNAWTTTGLRSFNYRLGWTTIDHQNPDGNMFDFLRKGEWLTKEVTGYGASAEAGRSDWKNTLTVQNDPSLTGITNYHIQKRLETGSQYVLGQSDGDPTILARSVRSDLFYVMGDATNLYNYCRFCWESWGSARRDVQHVSRSLVWIKPDVFVIYDRARTATAGRFKRFWLNLPNKNVANDTITANTASFPGWADVQAGELPGNFPGSGVAPTIVPDAASGTVLTTGTSPRGQKLFVRTLLPAGATASIVNQPDCFGDSSSGNPAIDNAAYGCTLSEYDAMTQKQLPGPIQYRMTYTDGQGTHQQNLLYSTRLRVDAPNNPANARFLHVVEGADAGASAAPSVRIQSTAGTAFDGAVVAGRAVLFPVDVDYAASFATTTYTVPASAAQQVVTGLVPNGSYNAAVTAQGGNLQITLTAGGSQHTADAGGVLVFAAAAAAANVALFDFNDDGRSDILLRDTSTGENYLYPMNGPAIAAGEGYIRTVAAPWTLAGIGDFDGNGTADLLWRNTTTGENYVYFMNGTTIASEGYIRTVPLAWSVAGVADLDGDGRADILLRNTTTGENYLYPMDGFTIKGNEGYIRTVPSPWTIAGLADFNNDGRADILLRNTTTGENYLYPMNGTAILAGEGYLRTVPSPWSLAGIGDFDGNGAADLFWRNTSTGENYFYFMNGTAITSEGYVRTVPLAWSVASIADFNGDGRADILLRNTTTGENYLYPMNGTAILGTEGYVRTVPTSWSVVSK
jgi:hypothetical protein